MKFQIEQIAIVPKDPIAAKKLLSEIGATDWAEDHVVATGNVGADESPGARVVAAGLAAESDVSLLISRSIKNPRSTAIAATTTLTVVETLTPLPAFEELRS